MFLTDAELVELTGQRQKSAQIRWLQLRRWRFETTATGHPRVARDYFERKMVCAEERSAPAPEPNWGALRQRRAA